MSYRDSEAWREPSRAPQHASQSGYSGPVLFRWLGVPRPVSRQAHQALKLLVTAGIWAAGLCLVIGSIALVVSSAGAGHAGASRIADAADHDDSDRPVPSGAASPYPDRDRESPSYRVVAAFSGRGNATTRLFSVPAGSRWEVRWAYTCLAGPLSGQFIVADEGAAHGRPALGPSISQSGASGHGTAWLSPRGAQHYLLVISTCSWRMSVAVPS